MPTNASEAAQALHNSIAAIIARRAAALRFHAWRKQDENMRAHEIRSEYVATICRTQNGELDPDHSEQFFAADQAEAIHKANEWAIGMLISDPSWLRVTLDGVSIFTKKIRLSNGRRPSGREHALFASARGRS